jgi:glycosyltransferase involved in cell wall biosynthesis
LIADAYVPIHIEVASRQFHDKMQSEETDFISMSPYWLSAVNSADIVLCASKEQQAYYLGIFSATGHLRPSSYAEIRIVVVPFGYFPKSKKVVEGLVQGRIQEISSLSILWYGGFYPWFDTSKFADVLVKLDSLISGSNNLEYQVRIIGAENPFIEDENFKRHSKKQIQNLEQNDRVSFSPWLPFNEREKAFQDIDVVICLTSAGYENTLAWRTRYLDFIEYSVPLLTNSSDPLSTLIVNSHCGWKFNSTNTDELALKLRDFILDRTNLINAKENYQVLQKELTWDASVSSLVDLLELQPSEIPSRSKPINNEIHDSANFSLKPNLSQLIKFGINQLRTRGLRSTLARTWRFLSAAFHNRLSSAKPRAGEKVTRAIIFVHQLDFSGSPLIAFRIAQEIRSNITSLPLDKIEVYCSGRIDKELADEFKDSGVALFRMVKHLVPDIYPSDLVIVNGLAHPESLVQEILKASLVAEYAPIFLAHEDRPLKHLSKQILEKMGKSLDAGFIKIVAPSIGTTNALRVHTNSELIETRPYPINEFFGPEADFSDSLRIHLTGSTHDFRKNQQFALILLSLVYERVKSDSVRYRQIHLSLIGVDEETSYGKFIADAAISMKKFVSVYPPMKKTDVEKIVSNCNAVICVSEYEALPLFVSESMAKGQLVLRNDCSGQEEQISDLKNGLLIKMANVHNASEKIISLLDRTITSDETLKAMGQASKSMVEKQIGISCLDYLGWPETPTG